MRLVLRPLISYLESLVSRYIPLARGDVRKKKKKKGEWGRDEEEEEDGEVWHILSAGAKYVARLPC